MASAIKNTQLIELNSEVSRQENANKQTTAFAGRKAQASARGEARDTVRKPPSKAQQATGKKVGKTRLINKLNFINFQDGTVLINFSHLKYDKVISLKASPQPCMGDFVDCLWSEANYTSHINQSYEFSNF